MAEIPTKTQADRIKFVRKLFRFTQEAFAKELHTTRGAVGNWELGKGIKTENLSLIASRFPVSLDWLIRDQGPQPTAAGITANEHIESSEVAATTGGPARGLPVAGEVAAGLWLELSGATDVPKYDPIPIGPDPRYPAEAQFGLVVRGTSINRIAAPGDVLICVNLAESGADPLAGDLVVIERRRMQEGQREVTAKRIHRRGRKIQLVPDSEDPAWQTPTALDPDHAPEGEEIAIVAIVTGIYRPVRRSE